MTRRGTRVLGAVVLASCAAGACRGPGAAPAAAPLAQPAAMSRGEAGPAAAIEEPVAADAEPVTLVVVDGTAISGRVVGADGSPVSNARVKCKLTNDDDPDNSAEMETDDAGRFDFSGLDVGTYCLSVEVGLDAAVVTRDVTTGRADVELRMPAPATIEGVLLDEDGDPAAWRRLVAVRESLRDEGSVSGMTDAEGKFRLEGVGDEPCRIEVIKEGAVDRSDCWPLLGGTCVSPGAKDVSLRMAARAATRIAGRVVSDAGRPFVDCEVVYRTRPNVTFHHSCDVAGSSFESAGLTPGDTCTLEVRLGGRTWFVPVPVGTTDLVLTAGADGLRRVSFGGHDQPISPPR